ncbi:MAG TPA: VanZ family protein [Candidatus Synoicihabitans sp.]|nr:VanZ family protein [Candidatus Synoicihabitans sp.]
MKARTEFSLETVRLLTTMFACCVIGFLALRASPRIAELPWIPAWAGSWIDHHYVLRNVPAFAALAFVVRGLLGPQRWVAPGLLALATGLEVAQLWLPTRFFDWRDIIASYAGLLFGYACLHLLRRGEAWLLGEAARPTSRGS